MQNYESLNRQQVHSETDPFTEERYKLFSSFLPRSTTRVLDIGCNTGRGGRVLKQLNPQLVISGLDVVSERLACLPSDTYVDNILGSSTAIPAEDGAFDAVVAGEFIEHLYPLDVERTLCEIFRVLKVGGSLLLTTPNPSDIKLRWRRGSILGGSHVSQHHHDTLKTRLRMIGFGQVRILGSGKVTRYLGCRFPFLPIYGSYLAVATKH